MRLILVICASILSGCATLSSPPEPSTEQASVPSTVSSYVEGTKPGGAQLAKRQALLSQFQQWSLSARISIRRDNDAWAGQMRWKQAASDYLININAPLGQGAMQLKSHPQYGVEMKLANGKISYADDPKSLLYDFTGWEIPIAGLKYWVQGVPNKSYIDKIVFDQDGRIQELQQGEWHIDYRSYRSASAVPMPRKLILRHGALKIILVVDQWNLTT